MAFKLCPFQPDLSPAPVSIGALRDNARSSLVNIIDALKGSIAMVLDKNISGPLGLVIEARLLKDHGVAKIFHLTPGGINCDVDNIVFLVFPTLENMRMIASQVRELNRQVYVCFMPRKSLLCERIFNEERVSDLITIKEFSLDLIPFDFNTLSLEMPTNFRDCFVDGDPTSLFIIARALMKLQFMFGLFPNIKGKGTSAMQVVRLLMRLRKEQPKTAAFNSVVPEINTILLFDRTIDMVTPLLTQRTYEGLMDEVLEINNGYVLVDPDVLGGRVVKDKPGSVKLPLNSSDGLFDDIRGMNFADLGPYLAKRAETVQSTYEERHNAVSIAAMQKYMKKFKNTQQEHGLLQIHISLAERVKDVFRQRKFQRTMEVEQNLVVCQNVDQCEGYIQSVIAKQEPLLRSLRLLSLLSLTQNGLKPKKLDSFREQIINSYGYDNLFTLQNLQKIGLLSRNVSKSDWSNVCDNLNLVQTDTTPKNDGDIAAPFAGYIPLIVRLVELASHGGWKSIESTLSKINGPTFEYRQEMPSCVKDRSEKVNSQPPVTLVFFLGGVTFAEIAALRALEARGDQRYIIATTKLINGNSLLGSLVDFIENNLDRSTISS